MTNNTKNNCRVCGLKQEEPPWGGDGRSPTYDICDCCGVEFGYGDTTVSNCIAIRDYWIKEQNMSWRQPSQKPREWLWEIQKWQIPDGYQG